MRTYLREKNEGFYELNREHIERRREKLLEAGKYRTLLNRDKFHRGWMPNWSDTVRDVADVVFDTVRDPRGQASLTKQVLPVSASTEVGPATQIERRGNTEVRNRARTLLRRFADGLYFNNHGKRMTLAQAAGYLNEQAGFKGAITLARVNQKSPIGNFLKLFPEYFEIDGNYLKVKPRHRLTKSAS